MVAIDLLVIFVHYARTFDMAQMLDFRGDNASYVTIGKYIKMIFSYW